MASAGYGPVNGAKVPRDDEDGLVDEWGVRYEGHHKPGGGTFGKHRRTRRRYLYMAAGAVVLFIIIVIIAVSVQKHTSPAPQPHNNPHQTFGKWKNNTNEGLTMYPRPSDGSVLIKYDSRETGARGYQHYINSLDQVLSDYGVASKNKLEYDCSNGTAPADKVCSFDTSVFKSCDKHHNYGYSSGTPCILLQLNLPRNETAVPFGNNSRAAKVLKTRYSPDFIGVSCNGLTQEDKNHMKSHDNNVPSVQYFPRNGFPVSWFRPRSIDTFLAPVVMVKLQTVQDSTYVRVKCTAWAKSFNNGQPENSSLYSTTFAIYHI